MWNVASLVLILSLAGFPQSGLGDGQAKITVIDTRPLQRMQKTNVDGGPSTGDGSRASDGSRLPGIDSGILNNHFFPGVAYFNQGMYSLAIEEFNYVVARPDYLAINPRQAEYLSTGYYLRGMIYLYHAEGFGRHALAKADFESSIKWNSNNYVAYLELSRVYSGLDLKEPAVSLLTSLHAFELEPGLAKEVEAELARLNEPAMPAPAPPKQAGSVAGASGKISVSSAVRVDIFIAGKQVGSTPVTLELAAGDYTLEYRHEDLTTSVGYTVKPGATITATVSFEVVVNINANPWAEVFIEGNAASLGQTPLTNVKVPVGAWLIFRNPAFPEKRQRIASRDHAISVVFP